MYAFSQSFYIPFCIFGIFFDLSSWRPFLNCEEAYLVTWSVRFVLNIFGLLAQYRRLFFFFSMFISTKQNLRGFWCWDDTLQFCLNDVNMTGANTLRKGLRIWQDFFKESMMVCWHRHAWVTSSYSTQNCILTFIQWRGSILLKCIKIRWKHCNFIGYKHLTCEGNI